MRVQKRLQAFVCANFTGGPCRCHGVGPVNRWEQFERFNRYGTFRCRADRLSRAELFWFGHWLERLIAGQQRPPERREHLIRFPLFGGHMYWLKEQPTVEAFGVESVVGQRFLDGCVACDDCWLIPPIPNNVRGGVFPCERSQRIERRPPTDHHRGSSFFQRLGQPQQRKMQPPSGCRTGLPWGLLLGRPDKHRHNVSSSPLGCHRRIQSGIVVESQIVAKPDDRRGHGGGHGYVVPCSSAEQGPCTQRKTNTPRTAPTNGAVR